jgi:hypothetical protein
MRHRERIRQALYWTAVSLLVCERLPFEAAARRMGIDEDTLKDILDRHFPSPELRTDRRKPMACRRPH